MAPARKRAGQTESEFSFGSGVDSQYSLARAVAMQSPSGSETPARKSARHSTETSTLCRHCPEPTAKNQVRCWLHKRAYDCMLNNLKKDGDAAEMAVFEETFGKSGEEPAAAEKANEVMTVFLAQFPDGKSKLGRARGKGFKLSSVIHSQGFRKESAKVNAESVWDFEIFCSKMRSLRNWDHNRCKEQWDLLRADPNVYRDHDGPRWSKERQEIPAWLTGDVRRESKDISYEERRLDTQTKPKAPMFVHTSHA